MPLRFMLVSLSLAAAVPLLAAAEANGAAPLSALPLASCAAQTSYLRQTGSPRAPTECADGIDNDGDSLVDMSDDGCDSASDNDEAGASGQWTQGAPIPEYRQEHSAAALDGRYIYLIGGLRNAEDPVCAIDRYDTLTDTWTAGYGNFPAGRCRHHFNAVVYNGEVYVAGGKTLGDDTGTNWVDKWNPVTNIWTQLPDLPEIHWGGPTVLLNGRLHVVSGATGNTTTTNHHFELDLADIASGWVARAVIPQAVVHAGGVSLNGKLYVLGGEGGHHHPPTAQYATVYSYDPAFDAWTQENDLPLPRNHIEGNTFVAGGSVWSVSGVNSAETNRGQEEIFTSMDGSNWSAFAPSLPLEYIAPSALMVNGRIYVMGGWAGNWGDQFRHLETWIFTLQPGADSDGDGVADAADVCPNNAPWLPVDCDGRPRRDSDGDCDVDAGDIAIMAGELVSVVEAPMGCNGLPLLDVNEDGILDGVDLQGLVGEILGP